MSGYGTSNLCTKCGKPFTYVGDVPQGGFVKGQAPYCECGTWENNPIQYNPFIAWKFCPHCGKELK